MRLTIYKHLVIDKDRPVVFLDMDGVLNGGYQHEHYDTLYRDDILSRPTHRGDYVLKSIAVPMMRLLKEHRVQVILISSWYQGMIDASHPQVDEFQEMFGIQPLGSLNTGGGNYRGKEVADCLSSSRPKKWVIVDDCDHFHDDPRLPISNIISPSGRYGMQPSDLEQLEKLLTA